MRISVDGELPVGCTAKDVILAIIGKIGTAGGTGYVVEYAGSVIRGLSMEGRMTVCNMSIEAGARAGLIAPDEKTIKYFEGRPMAPKGAAWEQAAQWWRTLPSDEGALYDTEIALDAATIEPQVTWGTSPQDVVPITGAVPDPKTVTERGPAAGHGALARSIWASSPARRWSRSRSTPCSSAPAPTAGSRICASSPSWSRASRSPPPSAP